MSMAGATLANLQNLYFFLDQNFDDLIAKCTTDDQRQQLRHDYVVARDAFVKARNSVFQDDDPMVKSLNDKLGAEQTQISGMLTGLQDITKLLAMLTSAVNLAGRLLTLGASA
jgi:hypothetical protein